MSDLQKAIEQNIRIIFNMGKLYERGEIEYDLSKGCNRIKSLLEKVAKEQKKATLSRNDHALVTDNLTFNEE